MIDVQNRISKKFAVVDDYWRGCIYMYNCIPYWWFLGRMDASTILTNSWHRVGADDNVIYGFFFINFALVVKPIIHIELKSFTLNLRLIFFFWKLRYIIRFLKCTRLNFLTVQTQIQTICQIIIIDQMLKRFNQNRRQDHYFL